MSFQYKNPITAHQVNGTQSVPRNNTYGTTFSVNNTGGYMEVFSLSDLYYTIPSGTTGSIEYSGNTIPIEFTKGTGAAWSPDVITLASDNISSGRRRLGMLVYVYEVDQVYQYYIDNYETLFNAATASTGCAQVSDFGTTINNKTAAGQSFINSWTANTIQDVSGETYSTAVWRKFSTGAGQVIYDTILSNTEVTISTTTIATSTSDTDFLTYSYTPTSSSSYLIIHYHLASYDFTSGGGNDSYISRIKVDGGEITYGVQSTVNGFRTGVLFPLTGRYTNSNTTAKSIVVACRRSSADDSISIVNSSTSMWLRITEIGR
jgi:hypothetical protein